jgi:hypothetical protein
MRSDAEAPDPPGAALAPPARIAHIPEQRVPGPEEGPSKPASPAQPAADDGRKSGPGTWVIVGAVIGGATLLVLIGLGIPALLRQFSEPATVGYTIGDCVVESAGTPSLAACTTPGAYRITEQVAAQAECPDRNQPSIEVRLDPAVVYCLQPVAAPDPDTG